jgi:hypothetical protein
MDERKIEEYRSNTIKWFKSDHLRFYTDWSQMYDSRYDDSPEVFSFFTASGEMTSMVEWFNESRSDFDDSDINVAKICSCIWKRIHPPSYLLYCPKKIEASPDQNGYDTASFRRMKLRFDSLPHSFSIMKKRAISIIAGGGSHFFSYLAVHFGAHFQEENSTNRDSTFIANINSGDGSANVNPFIQWLFAVIYELEVWVAQFLNTSALGLIESPYLAKIGRKCKRQIQSKEHIVCSIPVSRVTRMPTQEDTCNCGIYLLLNTQAAFLGERNHHVRWNKVHNAHALWTLVLKPFWELPKKQRGVRLEEPITKFRFNFYTLLREQSRGLTKWKPYRDRPSSSLSPLATAPSNELATNGTDTAANEITLAYINTMSSDPDSDDGDGEGGKDITASEQADKLFAGMFSTHLKEKATPASAMVSKQTRLQRGRWREKSAKMTYEERQKYFNEKHQQVDEKALMSTQPELEAKMETKRKNREWSENSEVIEGIFRKPAKLLQKEKKQVAQLLDEKFPQIKSLERRLISWYLKYCISSISLLSSVHSRPKKEMLDARLV